ncbi:HesB-like (seleno)protein [Methanocaldococcus villosus KIN24-T80]|uniref:HesB-like (Seleno)protein n=1 Tax=Methanocaldococcus villosus KIN24-T80 TaxID=1069083 RepID=N6VS83_9EURY|nr:HesB-like (seleno)protein [Methanocaldococcus villosus KIN24-T80]
MVIKDPSPNDELVYDKEFKIYVDPIVKQFLDGGKIKLVYKKSIFGEGVNVVIC